MLIFGCNVFDVGCNRRDNCHIFLFWLPQSQHISHKQYLPKAANPKLTFACPLIFYTNTWSSMYTPNATSQATTHCSITTPNASQADSNSLRTAAIAATQGVYNNVNTRKLIADMGVKSVCNAGANSAVLVPINTPNVLMTASFALKPVIKAVVIRQSSTINGAKVGAS